MQQHSQHQSLEYDGSSHDCTVVPRDRAHAVQDGAGLRRQPHQQRRRQLRRECPAHTQHAFATWILYASLRDGINNNNNNNLHTDKGGAQKAGAK